VKVQPPDRRFGRKPRRHTVRPYKRSLALRAASHRAVPAVPDVGVSLAVSARPPAELRAGSPPRLRRCSLPAPTPATGAPNHLVVTRSAQPDYPDWLRASGVRVIVRMKTTLRADGSVESACRNRVTVAKSNGLGSDEKVLHTVLPSSVAATRSWKFASDDPSIPLPASVYVEFDFHSGLVSNTVSGR